MKNNIQIMVCGERSSGKSTIMEIIYNELKTYFPVDLKQMNNEEFSPKLSLSKRILSLNKKETKITIAEIQLIK